ncbi:MAG TPA: hypothetical protein PLO67_12995 [Saprospiraceae bacterium]|nr:hypothetical protein [Saprospiraceae bacterium]HPI06788.1 hypothetical protein [Saprospiraceae bacterium]
MNNKTILWHALILLFVTSQAIATAQSQTCEPLKSVENRGLLAAAFSGNNKITNVCLLSEGRYHVVFKIEYKGYADKDYKVSGRILDADRKPVNGFRTTGGEFDKESKSAEIRFNLTKNKNGAYPTIEGHYLSLVVTEKSNSMADVALQEALNARDLFRFDRLWQGDSPATDSQSSTTVFVKLTPYKSAKSIKQ